MQPVSACPTAKVYKECDISGRNSSSDSDSKTAQQMKRSRQMIIKTKNNRNKISSKQRSTYDNSSLALIWLQILIALIILQNQIAPQTNSETKRNPTYFDNNGTTRVLKPTDTFWYNQYVCQGSSLTDKEVWKFQNRFRMSFDQFDSLLTEINNSPTFARWKIGSTDSTGRPSTPLSLLLLGALWYLGTSVKTHFL